MKKQNEQKNKNCGSKNCGNKNCGKNNHGKNNESHNDWWVKNELNAYLPPPNAL